MHTHRIDRRTLFQAGAAGAATVSFAGAWTVLEAPAGAAPLRDELRRSTWLALGDLDFELTAGSGAVRTLTLREVADLPVAAEIAPLRGHDGAFALRFDGPAGIGQGARTLRNAALGEIELFIAPVEHDGRVRSYEAIVDRTIRIAGVNEEGQPQIAPPAPERVALPPDLQPGAAAVGATSAAGRSGAARPRRVVPRLRRVRLTRATSRRAALADVVLADAGAIVAVRAILYADGKAVGRAGARLRGARRARLRFAARRPLARARYELALTLVARDGRVTKIRRRVRFA